MNRRGPKHSRWGWPAKAKRAGHNQPACLHRITLYLLNPSSYPHGHQHETHRPKTLVSSAWAQSVWTENLRVTWFLSQLPIEDKRKE